jgi:hypothetical protein
LPTVNDALPKIANTKVFTVMDAKEGFWNVIFDEESSLLTILDSVWQVSLDTTIIWSVVSSRGVPEKTT